MVYAMLVACASLYMLFVIACWRIAGYFCVRNRWMVLVPVLNLLYFAAMCDTVAIEAHDSKTSHTVVIMSILLFCLLCSGSLHLFRQSEVLQLIARIGVILFTIFTVLVFCWCYMTVLENSFDFPTLVCMLSLIIPFPVWLFIASFTIKGKTAEVIELYWG